jgi:Flp pilus assembly protein TadD
MDEPQSDENQAEQPEQKDLATLRGEAQQALDYGKNEEALKLYAQVLELLPEPDAETYNKIGICLARQEELVEAEEAFEKALELDERYAPALSNLGNICFSRDELERAEELYKEAIKNDPEYPTAHNNLAALYKKQGKIGEAVTHIKKSQRLKLRNPPETSYTAPDDTEEGGRSRFLGCWTLPAAALLAGLLISLTLLGG